MRRTDYHLYSPEETVSRARSRLGEEKYALPFNNCEHFAI
ncbi:MAG: lecithin retinol acyltransferase family protein [Clostridiales bacterium]|nr:lecithin retinol acyltransferase family protein [Clostridiales bacterium]